jgi:hypothetical protein
MAPPGETRVAIPEISASIGWPAPGFGARRAGLCRVVSVRFAVATLRAPHAREDRAPSARARTSGDVSGDRARGRAAYARRVRSGENARSFSRAGPWSVRPSPVTTSQTITSPRREREASPARKERKLPDRVHVAGQDARLPRREIPDADAPVLACRVASAERQRPEVSRRLLRRGTSAPWAS